jgi:hypothetical protein
VSNRSKEASLVDHLVGAGEEHWVGIQAERRHATRVRAVELAAPANVVLSNGPKIDLS